MIYFVHSPVKLPYISCDLNIYENFVIHQSNMSIGRAVIRPFITLIPEFYFSRSDEIGKPQVFLCRRFALMFIASHAPLSCRGKSREEINQGKPLDQGSP